MKDIYDCMSSQNILNYYGSKLDIKVDKSKYFDHEQEKTEKFDLVLDYSEYYDFQIDPVMDYEIPNPIQPKVFGKIILSVNLETDDYYMLTEDGLILQTVGYNQIQFQP